MSQALDSPETIRGGGDTGGAVPGRENGVQAISDDPGDDVERPLEFTNSGLIRAWVMNTDGSETRYRLRRPFLGELEKLRLSAERAEDEVADGRSILERHGRRIMAEVTRITEDESLDDEAKADAEVALRTESRTVAREATSRFDGLRAEWWSEVFGLLSLDGAPTEMPGWIVDPGLISAVMQHWRTAPFRSVGRTR